MKIAIIFDNFGPYHVARLVAASKVCDLLAIEINGLSSEYAWRPADTVPFRRVTLYPTPGDAVDVRQMAKRLQTLFFEADVDVVAIPGWSGRSSIAALAAAKLQRLPVIVMSESQECDSKRFWFIEYLKKQYLKLCQTGFVGGKMHADYLRRLGMRNDLIFFGYDAVDNGYFRENADKCRSRADIYRSRHQLPERYFLASSRFIAKKNLVGLINSYAKYRAEQVANGGCRIPLDLVLLGDGEMRATILAEIARLDLEGCVHLKGFQQYEDLPSFYALATVFVHASTSEQWGLVVNEAMASGLPVLVSERCGCASELVQSGVNGWAFPPNDQDRLVELMLTVDACETELNDMGRASRTIVERCSPEQFATGIYAAAVAAVQSINDCGNHMQAAALLAVLRFLV